MRPPLGRRELAQRIEIGRHISTVAVARSKGRHAIARAELLRLPDPAEKLARQVGELAGNLDPLREPVE